MTRAQAAERDEAIEKLRGWLKPGDTVYTILDHVSASGMSRAIRVVLFQTECKTVNGQTIGKTIDLHPNWAVGRALGLRHWKRNGQPQDALVVGGAGMDMGFHLVYNLGRVLFPDGFPVVDDHGKPRRGRNGDMSGHDSDGGYALNHRWL